MTRDRDYSVNASDAAGPTADDRRDRGDGRIQAGPLTLDLDCHTVTVHGRGVELTPLQFRLLRVLAERPGWVFPTDTLVSLVWEREPWGDNRMVPVHVGRLRQKLEQNPRDPELIVTVRGVGYKLAAGSNGVPAGRARVGDVLRGGADEDILAAASVLGSTFDSAMLGRVWGCTQEALLDCLDGHFERGTIEPADEVGGYRFTDESVRKDLYEALPPGRRARLHLRAGEELEECLPPLSEKDDMAHETEGLDTHLLETVTRHFLAAAPLVDGKRVLGWARLLARRYAASREHDRAADLLSDARSAAEAVGSSSPDDLALLKVVAEEHGDYLRSASRYEEAVSAYSAAEVTRQEEGGLTRARRLRKAGVACEKARFFSKATQYLAAAEAALEDVRTCGKDAGVEEEPDRDAQDWWEEWVEIQLARMWVHYYDQDQELGALISATRDLVTARGSGRQLGWFYGHLLSEAYIRERYRVSDEVVQIARDMLGCLCEYGVPRGERGFGHFGLGFALLWRGKIEEAENHLQIAVAEARAEADKIGEVRALTYLTVAARLRREAIDTGWLAHRALQLATAAGSKEYAYAAHANLAWVSYARGNVGSAREKALFALDGWEVLPNRYPFQWLALWPLTDMARSDGDLAGAVGYVERMLEPTQMRPPDLLEAEGARVVRSRRAGDRSRLGRDLARLCSRAKELGYL